MKQTWSTVLLGPAVDEEYLRKLGTDLASVQQAQEDRLNQWARLLFNLPDPKPVFDPLPEDR